jgi:crossover junction endodeoxyribonuclease RusA
MRFYPPSKRRMDMDNAIASMKAALDGMADGLGCDDSLFRLSAEWGDSVGGQVVVSVSVED